MRALCLKGAGGAELKCPNCGQETKGIKLNGKLFCGFCGEVIKDSAEILEEAYEHQETVPIADARVIEPKIITDNPVGENKSSKYPLKETGVETPDSKKEKTKSTENASSAKNLKITNRKIQKHERHRADKINFELLPNEPDPIKEPELSAPKDILVEKPIETSQTKSTESETNFTLLSKQERKDIEAKKRLKQQALTNYFRQTSGTTTKKRKKKSKNHRNSRWPIFVGIGLIAVIILVGLVYYVNFYATKEEHIAENLERKATFAHNVPAGIPDGYHLSYLSDSDSSSVKYFYIFGDDDARYVSVKIESTDIKSDEVFNSIIKNEGIDFTQVSEGNLEFWQTGNNKIFVIKDNLLYTFENSGELFPDTFLKFAKETLL